MRIYSLSKVLALPVILLLFLILYLEYGLQVSTGYWILLPAVLGVVLYISYGNIDFWFLKKFPVKLDKKVVDLLNQYIPFYRDLNAEDKKRYEAQLSTYISGRSFKSVGSELKNVPYDIRAMIATNAVQIAFYQEDILIGDFDRIFIYKHPFQSPKYKFLHTVETHAEDGVIIYSLEQLMPGITNPELHYNIGMHGYVEAFIKANPAAPFPPRLNADWFDVLAISGHSQKKILATVGFENVDMLVVLGTCYFTYPEEFKNRLPELNAELDVLFGKSRI
ncbi:MAG: hypothetical protein P1U56_21350 [Saprospiraceae bacterium]|nr:hypothetical protein [Saprospiraceae bacterium]